MTDKSFQTQQMPVRLISGISHRFPWLSQSQGQVAHVLLTRSPLIRPASWPSPFDLHVLSTPPAFVLSQNQTLRKCLHGTNPPKQASNRHTKQPQRANQIRLYAAPPPHGGEESGTHLNQDPPPRAHPPTKADTPTTTSHMASTIWHTVEFSRNRRASIQVLQPVRRQPF